MYSFSNWICLSLQYIELQAMSNYSLVQIQTPFNNVYLFVVTNGAGSLKCDTRTVQGAETLSSKQKLVALQMTSHAIITNQPTNMNGVAKNDTGCSVWVEFELALLHSQFLILTR